MPTASRALKFAFGSILVALAVMGLKFLAWALTGSVALYSDALESVVNLVSASVALWAVHYASRPADHNHPFGHHKAEYFSAVFVGVMIVVAALFIVREALAGLADPQPIDQPLLGMAINAGAAVVNAAWALTLIRFGRAERSPALVADGKHIMADVMTSVGVLVGLLLVLVTGLYAFDSILALIVGVNVLWEGWKVIAGSVGGLMDVAVDPAEAARIRAVIRDSAGGAIEVHDLKTRHAGPATFIEFHLVVDGDMTVTESHGICDRLEAALAREMPGARVTIHVEPAHKQKGEEGRALTLD
ncbi:cation transporter [Halovulum dunhuangense]|uniref:Protein p34 n=1 Tax=Halovulum dunhuangense TaxID=1505036 RepID=A0A849L6T5_9RHOB|nr:cation diffusion facilitator family transporter [Halovulum dunhuangense]NNU81854.1 cation transporter [Halovulum dunhuangense]